MICQSSLVDTRGTGSADSTYLPGHKLSNFSTMGLPLAPPQSFLRQVLMYSQLSWNCIDQAGLKIREPGLTSTLNLDLVAQSSLSLWIGNPSQNSHNSCLLVSLVFYGNVCVWGGGVVTYTESQPRSVPCMKEKPAVEVFAFTFLFIWLPSQPPPLPLIKQHSCFSCPL